MDLRDSWELKEHRGERKRILKKLFRLSGKGIRVCILSGDVHAAAVFRLKDKVGNTIYHLTSSPITYNLPRFNRLALKKTTATTGEDESCSYERIHFYENANYSLIRVDPLNQKVMFKLFDCKGKQKWDYELEF